METIYKYEINPHKPEIEMPIGAEILSVAFQGDSFYLWAKVNPTVKTEKRIIKAFGTGHNMPQDMGISYVFLGTGFMRNGLVFHAFEMR